MTLCVQPAVCFVQSPTEQKTIDAEAFLSMKQNPKPGVRFQPGVHRDLQNGISQIVSAVIPTLGPRAGFVVSEPAGPNNPPEILEDGGLIARRIVQLPHRSVDMGAMMARQLLWRMHEADGDGSATAAVILHAVFN